VATVHHGQLSLPSLRGQLMSSRLCRWVTELTVHCGKGLVYCPCWLRTYEKMRTIPPVIDCDEGLELDGKTTF